MKLNEYYKFVERQKYKEYRSRERVMVEKERDLMKNKSIKKKIIINTIGSSYTFGHSSYFHGSFSQLFKQFGLNGNVI